MEMRRFSTKAAIIATIALAAVGLLVAAIWFYPPLLLYGMIGVTGVVAYVAVYLLVLSKLRAPSSQKGSIDVGPVAKQDLGS